MIPYGRQDLNSQDIDAVVDVLRSDFLTQGPVVRQFEKRLAEYVGSKRSVVTNSATSALHLGCLALGVAPGDVVWTSAISFVASANAARYCGAEVDFVDIEPETFNMSYVSLERKLKDAKDKGLELPKVVIPVAMAGQAADMREIFELSKVYGFKILEDASHALGATYQDYRVGSCQYSDITVFSFHPVKMITTGEGGACTTNNVELAGKLERLRSHGITRDVSEMENPKATPFYYEQLELGYNYRLTDFQSALGLSQLARLDDFVSERNTIAGRYSKMINQDWITKPRVCPGRTSSFHLYIIRVEDSAPSTRDEIFEAMRANGVMVNLHYIPIYRHPYYAHMGRYTKDDYPAAEDYYSKAISLPIFPGISSTELDIIVTALEGKLGHQTIF